MKEAKLIQIVLSLIMYLPISALYENMSTSITVFKDIQELEAISSHENLWIVHQFTPSDPASLNLSSELLKAANVLKGVVRFGAIDISQMQKASTKMSLKIYPMDKSRPQLDISKVLTLKDLIEEVMKELSSNINERLQPFMGSKTSGFSTSDTDSNRVQSAVVTLTDKNFKDLVLNSLDIVMVAFVAPWCGHCKRLLPEWELAAQKLQGSGVVLGVVDATIERELATEFGVNAFPTIRAFGGGNKTAKSAINYEQGRVADDIVEYALNLVESTGVQKDKVPQLLNDKMMNDECDHPGRVCILVGLPHILESGAVARNAYKEVVKNASKAARGLNFKFLWFEGSAQPDLEKILEMTNGFPAVAAIRKDKGVYSVQRTAFSESHIRKFITGLTTGREPTYPLQSIPMIHSTSAWDGNDAEPYEDEPLEDIMSDEF